MFGGIFHLLHPMKHTVSYIYKAVRWSWACITWYEGCELLNWLAWHQIQVLLSSDLGQANGLSESYFFLRAWRGLLGIVNEYGSECVAQAHVSHACVSGPREGQAIALLPSSHGAHKLSFHTWCPSE